MKAYSAALSSEGRFTLPPAVRRAMKLKSGDEIEMVVLRDGRVFMRALNASPSAFFEAFTPRTPVVASDAEAIDALLQAAE